MMHQLRGPLSPDILTTHHPCTSLQDSCEWRGLFGNLSPLISQCTVSEKKRKFTTNNFFEVLYYFSSTCLYLSKTTLAFLVTVTDTIQNTLKAIYGEKFLSFPPFPVIPIQFASEATAHLHRTHI